MVTIKGNLQTNSARRRMSTLGDLGGRFKLMKHSSVQTDTFVSLCNKSYSVPPPCLRFRQKPGSNEISSGLSSLSKYVKRRLARFSSQRRGRTPRETHACKCNKFHFHAGIALSFFLSLFLSWQLAVLSSYDSLCADNSSTDLS